MTADRASPAPRHRSPRWWAVCAVVMATLLCGIKFGAYYVSGSSAILSDALESIVNIFTSGFALYAVWLGDKPRDHDHPYGHGRVEYFSAGIEGALVLIAAVLITALAIDRLVDPVPLRDITLGALLTLVVAVLTWYAGALLIRAGRERSSPAIEADGVHLRSDALTSFAVAAGVGAVRLTGVAWLDPAIALGVAGLLAWNGFTIVRRAVGGLMDEADPELLGRIAAVLEQGRSPGWIAPHRTKVHRLGRSLHIDLHIVFPRYWSLEQAHDASVMIEEMLCRAFGPHTETMVHMEACTPVSCGYCDLLDCPVRESPFQARVPWTAERVAAIQRPRPGTERTSGAVVPRNSEH